MLGTVAVVSSKSKRNMSASSELLLLIVLGGGLDNEPRLESMNDNGFIK